MGPGSEEDVKEIEELRAEIDDSRENLGAAVGALAFKADIPNRGKDAINEKKEALMEKVDDLKAKLPGGGEGDGHGLGEKVRSVGDAAPSREELKGKARGAAETAKDSPAAVAAAAAAAGLAAGLALPQSEAEKEKLAPKARQLRQDAESRVQEKVEQAKSALNVADQAKALAQTAAEVVREKGQQQEGKVGDVMQKAADKADERLERPGA